MNQNFIIRCWYFSCCYLFVSLRHFSHISLSYLSSDGLIFLIGFIKDDVINETLITTKSTIKYSVDQRYGKSVIQHRYDLRSSSRWDSVLETVQWQGLSEGYGSNDNRPRIGERIEWMVCHSGRQYLHHRLLLPAIINFLSQSDKDSYHHFHQKNLDVPFWQIYQYMELCSSPVLYCTITVVLHYLALQHHCYIVICVAPMKYCLQFTCW